MNVSNIMLLNIERTEEHEVYSQMRREEERKRESQIYFIIILLNYFSLITVTSKILVFRISYFKG